MKPPDAIRLLRVRLPLVEPLESAHGTERERDLVLVEWCRADGPSGWGECPTLASPGYAPEYTAGAWAVLRDYLIPAVLRGESPRVAGHEMAKYALECAAIDAAARSQGVGFAAFLADTVGAEVSEPVRVTGVFGISNDIDLLGSRIDDALAAGCSMVKLKVSGSADLDRVRLVRARFPDLVLAVDANASFTEHLDTAVLDGLGLVYIEQPFGADELVRHSELARLLRTPVALDESVVAPGVAEAAVALGAASVISVKPARLGSPFHALSAVDLVRSRGAGVFCGGMFETGVGRATALAVAAVGRFTLPADLAPTQRYLAADLTPALRMADGGVRLPEAPGFGPPPDSAALQDYTVDSLSVLQNAY